MHAVHILLDGGMVPHEHDDEQDEGQEYGHPRALQELDQRHREVERLDGGEEEEVEDQPVGAVIAQHGNSNIFLDRKSTRLNSSHSGESRMPSSA